MGDYFRKRSVGDAFRFPAGAYNAMLDAASQANRNKTPLGAGPLIGQTHEGIILVENNSGADRDQFEILGLDGVLFDATDNLAEFSTNWAMKGIVPSVAGTQGYFAVCAAPIAKDAVGPAYVTGVCPAWVNIATTTDLYADVTDNDATQLTSGGFGSAYILSNGSTTGKQLLLVRIGNLPAQGGIAVFGAAQSTAGWYDGTLYTGVASGTPPAGMTSAGACIIINLPDINLTSTWPVPNTQVAVCNIVGQDPASKKPLVACQAIADLNCGT